MKGKLVGFQRLDQKDIQFLENCLLKPTVSETTSIKGLKKFRKNMPLSDSKRPSRKELSIGAYSRGGKRTENETFTILKYEKILAENTITCILEDHKKAPCPTARSKLEK